MKKWHSVAYGFGWQKEGEGGTDTAEAMLADLLNQLDTMEKLLCSVMMERDSINDRCQKMTGVKFPVNPIPNSYLGLPENPASSRKNPPA